MGRRGVRSLRIPCWLETVMLMIFPVMYTIIDTHKDHIYSWRECGGKEWIEE